VVDADSVTRIAPWFLGRVLLGCVENDGRSAVLRRYSFFLRVFLVCYAIRKFPLFDS
jgi:hypothetical protein